MPEYPGGGAEMMKYIASIQYPAIARERDWEGTVYIQFVVEKDGSINNVAVARTSGHALLDSVSVAHISAMSKWKPGQQRGENVRVQYVVPIKFKLGSSEPSIYRVVDTDAEWGKDSKELDGYLAECPVPSTVSKKDAKGKTATLEVVISEDGSIATVKMLTSTGNAELDKSAVSHVKAMRKWKPAKNDGKNVASYRILKVGFKK